MTNEYLEFRRNQKLKSPTELAMERAQKEAAKKKPIAPVSAKRKEENKILEKVKKEKKKVFNHCQIASLICTKGPLRSHHVGGRSGPNLTNARKIIMACDACNGYVSDHPAWAKAHGFTESRTKTPEKFEHLKKIV